MDALARAGKLWDTYQDVAEFVAEARKIVTSREALLDALRAYIDDPAGSQLAELAQKLGIDDKRVQQWLTDHKQLIDALIGDVKAFDGKTFDWKGSAAGAIGGKESFEIGASAQLALAFDCDGTMLDDVITCDKDRDGFVSIQSNATIKAAAKTSAIVGVGGGTLTAKLAFGADADVFFANYFLVPQSTGALDAAITAARSLCLPGDPKRLLAQRRPGAGGSGTPLQWIHLRATNSLLLGGSLDYATLFVEARSGDLAGVDLVASVSAGANVGASFTYAHEGSFDLLLSASPDNESMVRVAVTRTRGSERKTAFNASLGVSIETTGLDELARKIGDAVLPPEVREVFEKLQGQGVGTALKEAVESKLKGKINKVVTDARFVEDLQAWIGKLDDAPDLKAKAGAALEKAGLKLSDAALKNVAKNLDAWTERIIELFEKYAAKVEQLQELIEKAASIKVGLHYARQRQALENATYAIVVDIDPVVAKDVYRAAIHGDFQQVMANRGTSGVHIIDGHLVTGGNEQVKVDCGISFFGLTVGSGSILTSEWSCDVSASGDVRIGVESKLEKWSNLFGRFRSLSFFTSTSVIATVGRTGRMLPGTETNRVRVELEDRFKAKENRLEEYARDVKAAGVVVGDSKRMLSEIHAGTIAKPDVNVSCIVSLEFEPPHLDRVLNASAADARATMAEALLTHTVEHDVLRARDAANRPAFDWDMIRQDARTGDLIRHDARAIQSGDVRINLNAVQWMAAIRYCLILDRFEAMLGQLRSFRTQSLLGSTPEETLRAIRNAHQALLKHVGAVIFFDKRGTSEAFFAALFQLADDGTLDPFAILTRADGETFVYGQEDRG